MTELVTVGPMLLPKWMALTALVAALPGWVGLMLCLFPTPAHRAARVAAK